MYNGGLHFCQKDEKEIFSENLLCSKMLLTLDFLWLHALCLYDKKTVVWTASWTFSCVVFQATCDARLQNNICQLPRLKEKVVTYDWDCNTWRKDCYFWNNLHLQFQQGHQTHSSCWKGKLCNNPNNLFEMVLTNSSPLNQSWVRSQDKSEKNWTAWIRIHEGPERVYNHIYNF